MSVKRPFPIVYTQPNFVTAGSGQLLYEIASGLDRDRFEPMVCLHRRGGDLEQDVRDADIPIIEAIPTVPGRPYRTLRRRIRQKAAELVEKGLPKGAVWHSFHYLDDYTEPLIARGVEAKAWVYSKKSMSWGSRAWWLRSMLADRILCLNTDMIEDFFRAPWLRRKTDLAPPGVDIEDYHPPETARLPEDRSPIDRLVIGCVAHLLPVKGHPTLIEAVARCPWAELHLAGRFLDEAYVDGLKRQIAELGIQDRVHLLGQVVDIPAFHRRLDIFVLPTLAEGRMEGCPVALLEAMASGLPVVATDIPGARDVIEPSRSGLLVPARDAEALAAALGRLQDPDRRRELGRGARRRIETAYSLEHEIAVHEAVYDRLIGR